jgi:hypothetical protein
MLLERRLRSLAKHTPSVFRELRVEHIEHEFGHILRSRTCLHAVVKRYDGFLGDKGCGRRGGSSGEPKSDFQKLMTTLSPVLMTTLSPVRLNNLSLTHPERDVETMICAFPSEV